MKTFYQILANTLIASVTNNFVWFALVFWVYLETQSVLATSVIGGIYLTITALSGFWFGSIVDHNRKKTAMVLSGLVTLVFFSLGLLFLVSAPEGAFKTIENWSLWVLMLLLLLGVIAGNIRNIALPTVTTILVAEDKRDKANGLAGTMTGISFAVTSFASGLVLAYGGMTIVMMTALALTVLTLVHLAFIKINEKQIVHTAEKPKSIDIKGTIAAIRVIPGLLALIFFTTFNNFLGGVFMSLMDAYGLSLLSVQVWGFMLGVLSFAFIAGGLVIARKGLGKNPLRTLFICNIVMWVTCIFFTIQPWVALLAAGMFTWMFLVPFAEAAEQTIIQKVVPPERQGRVFGFAQSVEQSASPLTAFMIGPVAQFIFIPFMTTGAGVQLIGDWFGVGQGRGIALVFIIAGFIGLVVTLLAMRSKSYRLLSHSYQK